ncbi:MAG: NifU family protein [Alphaproteobacteria bacterium]
MFIQTEFTPNPATMRFLPGQQIMPEGTANFTSVEAAEKRSPLARRLFAIEGVIGVFLGGEFITVTRSADEDWQVLQPLVIAAIMDHLQNEEPIIHEVTKAHSAEEDSEVIRKIKDMLDTRVRPAVAMDGGDIVFHGFEDGIVYLHMQGSCAGCPSASLTLKSGVENLLKHYIPEVNEVREVELDA